MVTGASSGIGAAVAERLVKYGMTVVGCARDTANLQDVVERSKGAEGKFHPVACDLKQEDQILAMYDVINSQYGGLDVCINSAGMGRCSPLMTGSTGDWNEQWQVNVMALCISSREALKSMKQKGIDDGHVIQINSISGHIVHMPSISHFYIATKHAVRALTQGLRQELREAKSNIRVSEVSPGLVKTDFMNRMRGPEVAKVRFGESPHMFPVDLADSVVYVLSAPSHVEVHDVLVAPTGS